MLRMPFLNNLDGPHFSTERTVTDRGAAHGAHPHAPPGFGRSDTRRHLGEVCPETMVIMPFAVPLLLAMRLRKWLRRRIGRRAGNVLGKTAIIALGGPPLLVASVTVLMMRLAITVLEKLDRAARTWRGA